MLELIDNFELVNIGPSILKFDGSDIDVFDAEVLLAQFSVGTHGYFLVFLQFCFEGDILLLQFYDRDLRQIDERRLPRNTDHALTVQKTVQGGRLEIVDESTGEIMHEITIGRRFQWSTWKARWISVERGFIESIKASLLNYFFSCCGYEC
uniref:Uncharacterized protein n=1 Tax=Plectus sambesii TaxID=2011161 RepID=A0A914VZ36_9BILA